MTGTYTDITEIVAPASARAGEVVPVTVRVKNTWTYQFAVYVKVLYDSGYAFESPDYWVYPGETIAFSGSFVMPDRGVTVCANCYYEDEEGYWHLDGKKEKDISLALAPAPEFSEFAITNFKKV